MTHDQNQELIDNAFRFLDKNSQGEASQIIDALLDICAQWVQGYEYPSYENELGRYRVRVKGDMGFQIIEAEDNLDAISIYNLNNETEQHWEIVADRIEG